MFSPDRIPQLRAPIVEHLKSPAQLMAITAATYLGIMIGKAGAETPPFNNIVPAFNNLVEILTKVAGGIQ